MSPCPHLKIKRLNTKLKRVELFSIENVSKQWGFDLPSFSHGISYADLDNDGDLDIVTNNMETEASIYKNNTTGNYLKVEFKGSAKNTFGYGSKVFIYTNNSSGTTTSFNTTPTELTGFVAGQIWYLDVADFDGDGKIDLAVQDYSSSKIHVLRNTTSGNTLSFLFVASYTSGSSTETAASPFISITAIS